MLYITMKRITEETEVSYKDISQLSYNDNGDDDILLYVDGELLGKIEVWTDRSHAERKGADAEYITLNYRMIYLTDIKKL
jgi:hypothetical protein